MEIERLSGGNMGEVFRVGDTVIRTTGPWTPAVHRLLRHLREQGLDWVPEPLGRTPDGREILRYIEGEVPVYPMPDWVWTESLLIDTARKLRLFHDATTGYVDAEAQWRFAPHEPSEVICHNDFAPYNMVFRDGRCVGVIDFDMASPGPRLWDLAFLAHRMVRLTDPVSPGGPAFSEATRLARLTMLVDAYGMPFALPDVLATTIERLEELARFSDRLGEEKINPEFHAHAALYRRDVAWIRDLLGRMATKQEGFA